MLCPRCASNQSDEIKFCTSCGANLQAVREALDAPDPARNLIGATRGWPKCSCRARLPKYASAEMERRLGITPEVKRYNEIKAGVIVSCVGIGMAIFLFFLMQAVDRKARPQMRR